VARNAVLHILLSVIEACLRQTSDDFGSLDSQLVVPIPSDGILVLGVTAYPDGGFVGGGVGTYLLNIEALAPIGSISGRIVDAVSRQPPAFSDVRLLRCTDVGGCSDVSFLVAGPDGGFRFSFDFAGQPLEAGTYLIIASAPQYQSTQTDPFAVREGEDRELGDVRLQPYPVQFSDPVPCANIPAGGGICRYSVRLTNRLRSKMQGAAWSIVQAVGIGSLLNYTVVQTDKPKKLTLQAQESKIVQFEFKVPAKVSPGAYICADVFFGDDRQQPLFNTLGQTSMFCITKDEGTSFSVVPYTKAQKVMRGSGIRKTAPSKGKMR
jgi:hypothetical protein